MNRPSRLLYLISGIVILMSAHVAGARTPIGPDVVYVTTGDRSTLVAIDLDTDTQTQIPLGIEARKVIYAPDGDLYLIDPENGIIGVLDLESGPPVILYPIPGFVDLTFNSENILFVVGEAGVF